jgi:hypothetical protein
VLVGLDPAPLTHGPQHEHGHDRDAAGGQGGAAEGAQSLGRAARLAALDVDDRVADEAAAEPGDDDCREGEQAGRPRRQGRGTAVDGQVGLGDIRVDGGDRRVQAP